MSRQISDDSLRRLRNDIPIRTVIQTLEIPSKEVEGFFRFLCPVCSEFHTATNPRTNLGCCFRCEENYNPIDLVMRVQKVGFLQAARFLSRQFRNELSNRQDSHTS